MIFIDGIRCRDHTRVRNTIVIDRRLCVTGTSVHMYPDICFINYNGLYYSEYPIDGVDDI